jgi:hypothetical protein
VTVNRAYRLRVEAIGSWIRGYIDGELLVEAVDRSMRDGRPALVTSGAQADFDNVVVTPSPLTPLFVETFDDQFLNPHWQVVSGLWNHVQPVDPETFQIHGYYEQTSAQLNGRVLAGADTHDQVVASDAWSGALAPGASYGLMARYVAMGTSTICASARTISFRCGKSSTARRSSWIERRSLFGRAHGTACGWKYSAMRCAAISTVASSSPHAISRIRWASMGLRHSGRLRGSTT